MLFLLLCTTVYINAQDCPPNLDFEEGNFDNWQCSIGNTNTSGGQNMINLTPSPPTVNRHTIVSAASGMDSYGNFPKLCPYGGNYSVQLGNTGIGAQAEGLSYTFLVPPTQDTFTFTYFYAVVFQNPTHTLIEQPRFFVTAYDVATGEVINCASFDYVSTSGLPGFEQSPLNPGVLYKNWSPASIEFANLANHTIRLEFKTADCTQGGHFGYAYVDVSSGCTDILATAPYCPEANTVTLSAPYGFQSYTWYNGNYSAVVGTGQSITLSPPPPISERFHVDMIPYPGFGCRDTADATVLPYPVPDTPVAVSSYFYCQNDATTPLTATPLPGNSLVWFTTATGGVGSAVVPIPSSAVPGVFDYYVAQKPLSGCEGKRKKITVTIYPKPSMAFTVNTPMQCSNDNNFIFTSTSTNLLDPEYYWDFGDGASFVSVQNTATHVYTSAGNHQVKLKIINGGLCAAQSTLNITVLEPPFAVIKAPAVLCENETLVQLTDSSYVPGSVRPVTGWWWNVNGNITTAQNPAPFVINTPGVFPVRLVVNDMYCHSDTVTRQLYVHHRPVAALAIKPPFCENEILQFSDRSYFQPGAVSETVNRWSWLFDGANNSTAQNPQFNYPAGPHRVQLIATSAYGCNSLPFDSVFTIHTKPRTGMQLSDSCVGTVNVFTANDILGDIHKWYWNFGSSFTAGGNTVPRVFSRAGSGVAIAIGENIYGCRDTFTRPFVIYDNLAFAGRDTSGPVGEPVQLNAHGGSNVQYLWSPPDGLSSTTIENPVAILNRDQLYNLYSISDKGCVRRSRINILRYKGPEIYIPTAFSPNGDGVNDEFKAVAYGVTQFGFLAVYDRYGNELFNTRDVRRGWDGKYKGAEAPAGTYVFMAKGVDFKGKEIFKKGTVILIR